MSGLSLHFPDELIHAIASEVGRVLREDGLAVSPWLNVAEAAAYLRVPEGRLRNLTAAKAIRYSAQGKSYIYRKDWLDAFAERQADEDLTICKTTPAAQERPGVRHRRSDFDA